MLNILMVEENVIYEHFDVVRNIVDAVNLKSLKCFLNIGSSDEYGSNLSPQFEHQRENQFHLTHLAKQLQLIFRNVK